MLVSRPRRFPGHRCPGHPKVPRTSLKKSLRKRIGGTSRGSPDIWGNLPRFPGHLGEPPKVPRTSPSQGSPDISLTRFPQKVFPIFFVCLFFFGFVFVIILVFVVVFLFVLSAVFVLVFVVVFFVFLFLFLFLAFPPYFSSPA